MFLTPRRVADFYKSRYDKSTSSLAPQVNADSPVTELPIPSHQASEEVVPRVTHTDAMPPTSPEDSRWSGGTRPTIDDANKPSASHLGSTRFMQSAHPSGNLTIYACFSSSALLPNYP